MILCCGEALIDMLPVEADGQPAFAPTPGGAIFNTARALARLGGAAGYFGGLSQDMFGTLLARSLEAAGVDTALALRAGRPTTLAFVEMRDGKASYAFYDENTAGRMLTPADLPDLPERIGGLFFGGISLMAEPCGSAFEALALREAGRRLIVLDPNIRPGFIADVPAYRARLDRLIAAADIVKLSDEDLAWIAGGDDEEAAAALLPAGPAMVVVTRGAEGALAVTPDGVQRAAAPRVDLVDTVGAGDTFNAGLLVGLARAGALAEGRRGLERMGADALGQALSLACRAGALSVARQGADPPWAHELEPLP